MKNLILIILCLFSFLSAVHAQKKGDAREIVITGKIYNIETLDSLPFSNIAIRNKAPLLSDANACFKARAFSNDTITISAIGFYDSVIALSELVNGNDSLRLEVLMKVKVYDLGEINLLPSSYSEFKRAFLSQPLTTTKEVENAHKNMEFIKAQMKKVMIPTVYSSTGYEDLGTFKSQDNHSLFFFSTGGKKGVIPTIKNLFSR
jgi:hypothetical protein